MKIGIPENIKTNIDQIDQVFLEGIIKEEVNSSNSISIEHICSVDFIELHDLFYNNSAQLRYKVLYKEGKTEYFTFASKEDILYRKSIKKETITVPSFKGEEGIFPEQWIWHCDGDYSFSHKLKLPPGQPPDELMYQSPHTSFADTPEDRTKVLSILKEKFLTSSQLSEEPIGNKNLIYYSVCGNDYWFEMFKLSLFSLIKQGEINYDVLVITTESFKQKILQLEIKQLNIDFLIVPEPISSIEPSINKLLIYQYEKLTEYGKVLFLDCDILAVRPFTQIFLKEIESKKLHTFIHSDYINKHRQHAHVMQWHGIGVATNEDLIKLKEEDQIPFNAGQFLFVPNQQMISHFENIHWFSKEWPQKYFFEQSLMTHYFCLNFITNPHTLTDMFHLMSIKDKPTTEISIKDVSGSLIHFIGESTNAESKLNFIRAYANFSKT